jgi:hypothetical protein
MGYIEAIIGLVVLLLVVAALWTPLSGAGNTLNTSGFPLGSLFVSTGAIWYILAAGVIYAVIRAVGAKK